LRDNDELELTVETLIELDEPEALLTTLKRAAMRRKGDRWKALGVVLTDAEIKLDLILNPKPDDKTPAAEVSSPNPPQEP
jgi:hypothetical protein